MTFSSPKNPQFVVAALYKFVSLDALENIQALLYSECQRCHIKGILLLASEGINGTIAGRRENIDEFLTYVRSLSPLKH